ncbi:metal tolerance protein 9-like [Silene latifolia]|uniref:metal tolerance protein 9-like n=1 Tax=Silene latifolia TaxID=37657 RepID=UPI003D773305
MATNQRVDSMDYRVEPLLPAASPHNFVETENDPPWQLSLDMFKLPADRDLGKSNMLGLIKRRKIAAYYKRQEDIIQGLNELEPSVVPGSSIANSTQDEAMRIARGERTAITTTNIANIMLLAAKIYASIETRSMAVIASTLDSLFDVLTGFILWFTEHAMKKPNPGKYPVGKTRMEPVGIVVFASVMAAFGLHVLFESVRQLITKAQPEKSPEKEKWMIAIMVSVTIIKFILMVYCRRFKNDIVRTYAQDHFFDVITNSISVATAVLGINFFWWIDPTGAIIIALYTTTTWARMVIDNIGSLIGRGAPQEYLTKLIYLTWNHAKEIKQIESVRAYHFGRHYYVEVDIVLPGDMLLSEARKIGDTLQDKLEQLPEVERAFVHVNHKFTHTSEQQQKTQKSITSTS